MQVITHEKIEDLVCKLAKKWGISFRFESDLLKSGRTAPWFTREYLGDENYYQCFLDKCGLLLFDTEMEARNVFSKTIWEPVWFDETGVYACLISPEGKVVAENT